MEEPTVIPPAPTNPEEKQGGAEFVAPAKKPGFSLADLPPSPLYRGTDLFFAVLPLWLYEVFFLITWSGRGAAKHTVGSNLGKIYLGLALAFAIASGVYFYLGQTKLFKRPWFAVWLGCVAYTVTFYMVFWLSGHGVRIRTDLVLIPVGIVLALGLGLLGSSWNAGLLALPWVLFSIPAVNGGPGGMLHPSSFAFISLVCLILSTLFVILFLFTRVPLQKWVLLAVLIGAVAALNYWAIGAVIPKFPEAVQQSGRSAYTAVSKAALLTLIITALAVVPELLRGGTKDPMEDEL